MRIHSPYVMTAGLVGASMFAAAAAYALVQIGPTAGIAVGLLPLAVLGAGVLLTHGRIILLGATLGLPLSGITVLGLPIALPGVNLYVQDIILFLAVASWAVAVLVDRGRNAVPVPRTPALGWPFVLFSAAIVTATIRGHYAYGASLFGQSLRMVLYAGIVVTLAGLTAHQLHRLLLWVFYPGVALTAAVALYYIATGTSQTEQFALSTGGARYLGISTSIYCAAALFLALLNLRVTPASRERVLHFAVAGLALFGVVVGFGRAVYAAVGVTCLLLLVISRPVRNSVLGFLPLALPFLILLGVFVAKASPELVESVSNRVSAPPVQDVNVQWRIEASRAVFEQIRERPLVGVGFGRSSDFFIQVESSVPGLLVPLRQAGGQDPHNGYLYLWAGGGLAALGSFGLILIVFAWDALRRFRSNRDPIARLVLLWTAATLGAFLLNVASGTSLSSPGDLLTIWALLAIPAIVPYGKGEQASFAGRPTVAERSAA